MLRGRAVALRAILALMRAYKLAVNASDHLVSRDQIDAAAEILVRYLEKHPPRPGVLRRLARIRMAQGRPAEAVPLLRQALERR